MRLFVAVKPPRQFSEAVDAGLDGLRRSLAVSWTDPRIWHLTLQFLGEWPRERAEALQEGLCGLADLPAFALESAGTGRFPERGSPRVFFLHLDGGQQARLLTERVRSVVGATWPEGPQDTRPWRPHLTLARIKRRLPHGESKLLLDCKMKDLPSWPAEGFSLMSSLLTPAGAEHREMAFFPLRK